MRVLVIGSGAREHALVLALSRDPAVTAVMVAPGNAGIATIAEQFPVDAASADEVVALATAQKADLVVIGPEAPLVAGVGDAGRPYASLEVTTRTRPTFALRHASKTCRVPSALTANVSPGRRKAAATLV